MALGAWYRWWNKTFGQRESVNLLFSFFFLVNYSLGTGFLAIPYSFFQAGYLAAIPTLLVVVFVTWIHASWVLEVMARAQVKFGRSQHAIAVTVCYCNFRSSIIKPKCNLEIIIEYTVHGIHVKKRKDN